MKIPLLLVSAVFRKDQSFFKWYGSFYRKMLFCFTQIFVQDKRSLDLLHANGIKHARVSGDTRFDRVWEIAAAGEILPLIKEFIGQAQSVVAGSTWPDDEKLLRKALASFPKLKLIIAFEIFMSIMSWGMIKGKPSIAIIAAFCCAFAAMAARKLKTRLSPQPPKKTSPKKLRKFSTGLPMNNMNKIRLRLLITSISSELNKSFDKIKCCGLVID